MWYALCILFGILYAEFFGYFIHRLLHSEYVGWLSRNHMVHHLKLYGPRMSMRTTKYKMPEHSGKIAGWEWLLPAITLIGLSVAILTVAKVAGWYQVTLLLTAIIWTHLLFNYMHDSMHIKDFWMLKVPILRVWFKKIRKLHDIHHVQLSEEGYMNKNYGICFHWMDWIFGTYAKKVDGLDEIGIQAAYLRYKNLVN